MLFSIVFTALPVLGAVVVPRQTSDNTAVVDLSVNRGTPNHLAAGLIYGIPDVGFGQSPTQIPNSFYEGMGFNYGRAGGAQIDAGGWIYGLSAYKARLASTKENYDTTRQFGGGFVLLPHDVWGTDHANSSTVWPGDNGDWSNYDEYLDTLISDLKDMDMLPGLVWDIWNEPDGSGFWARPQQQWLDLYVRTHQRIRSDPDLNSVLISGPTLAAQPTTGDTWWTNWLATVSGNDTIPDQYAWHLEGATDDVNDDLQTNNATLSSMLALYNLPQRQVNINEYGNPSEQVSAGAAWYMSRFERYDTIGLRGNWLSTCQLHDFMANLVGKTEDGCTGTEYFPNGEFQVYKYYSHNMTGVRAGTTGSGDRILDVFTTIGSDTVRTLAGVRLQTGTWYITIDGLSNVGLPTSGSLAIQTWGFDDEGHYTEVDSPSDRGVYSHAYSGDSVTFPVYQTSQDEYTAWAFEFAVGG